jgi:hypothetical protein
MGAIVFVAAIATALAVAITSKDQMIHHNPEDCGGQRRQQHDTTANIIVCRQDICSASLIAPATA